MTFLFNTIWDFILETLASTLPASQGIPTEVSTAFLTFMGYLNGMNLILPISTLLQCISIYLIFEGIIVMTHFTKWIIELVRGS